MSSRKNFLLGTKWTVLLGLLIGGGCSAWANVFLSDAPFLIFPSDDGRVLVVDIPPHNYLNPSPSPPPSGKSVYSLQLDTGQQEQLVSDIPAFYLGNDFVVDIQANSRWLTWVDRTTGEVVVREWATGEERRLLSELNLGIINGDKSSSGLGGLDSLEGLKGDLLVMGILSRDLSGCNQLLVVDLRTGDRTEIPDVWLPSIFSTDGEWFVWMDCLPSDVEVLELELSANFQKMSLITGERKTIRSDIRVSGSYDSIFIIDRVAYWEEYKEGNFRSRVVKYDLSTDESAILFKDFNTDKTGRSLVAMDAKSAVINAEPQKGDNLKLELWDLETGNREVFFDYPRTLYTVFRNLSVTLTDQQVVWVDPLEDDILRIYDRQSGVLNRIRVQSK